MCVNMCEDIVRTVLHIINYKNFCNPEKHFFFKVTIFFQGSLLKLPLIYCGLFTLIQQTSAVCQALC